MSVSPARVVYRVGDVVRIETPVFVVRVGYPLTWPMLMDEVSQHPHLTEALIRFGISPKYALDFERGIAKSLTRTRHFGGKKRSIHTRTEDELKGRTANVAKIRTAMTGTYNAPRFSSGGYDGELEWKPGYLCPVKAHRLLLTEYGEIEACNVSLTSRAALSKE